MRNVSIFVFIFFLSLSPKCNSNHLNSTGNIISFNVWLYNHIVIIRPLVSFLWCLTVHTCRRSLPMRHHPHSRSTCVCVYYILCWHSRVWNNICIQNKSPSSSARRQKVERGDDLQPSTRSYPFACHFVFLQPHRLCWASLCCLPYLY